ncbi:adenine-specific DNA methylase [Perkinsela sp. CCAP 1560/4]|nr:adenine-specific DNA methylase [Perkinsela sp. CCAP 1560/4]|eukprot:KNH09489.1 adenine-specific DNA methylase [Perkinsela sp. CCAP 1560/4]
MLVVFVILVEPHHPHGVYPARQEPSTLVQDLEKAALEMDTSAGDCQKKRVHFRDTTPKRQKVLKSHSRSVEDLHEEYSENGWRNYALPIHTFHNTHSDGEDAIDSYDNFPVGSDPPKESHWKPYRENYAQSNFTNVEDESRIYPPSIGLADVVITTSDFKRGVNDSPVENTDPSNQPSFTIFGMLAEGLKQLLKYIYHPDTSSDEKKTRSSRRLAFHPLGSKMRSSSRVKLGGEVGEWNLSEKDFKELPNEYLRIEKDHPGICIARKNKFSVVYKASGPIDMRLQIRRESRRYFGLLIHKWLEVARTWKCHTLRLPDLDADSIQWFEANHFLHSNSIRRRKEAVEFDRFFIPQNYERIFFESLIRRMPDETRALLQKHFSDGPWVSNQQHDQALEIRFGHLYKRWDRGRIASAFSSVNLHLELVRLIILWLTLLFLLLRA